ncbi:MAG: hypothetical protein HQL30_05985 [Candidatus Omnitrophica bacterium]|nr:hypothetical protein [Candidatus Omnitrophota bacterium]
MTSIGRPVLMFFVVTLLAVGYVHQRIEIIKAGYALQENKRYLACLADENSKLVYSLSRLESPKNLLSTIDMNTIKFSGQREEKDDTYQLSRARNNRNYESDGLMGRVMDLFTVSAEARTNK